MAEKKTPALVFESVYFVFALIAAVYYCILRSHFCEHGGGWEFLAQVAEGSGAKPWQYRILVPKLAQLMLWMKLPVLNSWDRTYNALEAASALGMLFCFRYFLSAFVEKGRAAVLSFLIFLVLPFNIFFPQPYHPFYWFDIPAVMFFALGMGLMVRKEWFPYYVVFVLATLNRETSCFLTMIYVLVSLGREKKGTWLKHAAAQFLIWIAMKAALFLVYKDNGGFAFELRDVQPEGLGPSHWADNIAYLSSAANYPMFLSNMAFLWLLIVIRCRSLRDPFLNRAVWVVFPYFAGMMVVANIYELRIFAELIPLFLAAAIVILRRPGPSAG